MRQKARRKICEGDIFRASLIADGQWTLIGQFAKKFPSCGRIVAKSRGELDIIDEHGGGGQKGGQ